MQDWGLNNQTRFLETYFATSLMYRPRVFGCLSSLYRNIAVRSLPHSFFEKEPRVRWTALKLSLTLPLKALWDVWQERARTSSQSLTSLHWTHTRPSSREMRRLRTSNTTHEFFTIRRSLLIPYRCSLRNPYFMMNKLRHSIWCLKWIEYCWSWKATIKPWWASKIWTGNNLRKREMRIPGRASMNLETCPSGGLNSGLGLTI